MLPVIAGVFAFLVLSIVPTATYLYVERRCRKHWAVDGVPADASRAPIVVRAAAWWSMAVGQLSIPWLLVPGVCGTILYTLAKIGRSTFSGNAVIVGLGVAALLQAIFVFRLFPLGIRLLAKDAKAHARTKSVVLSLGLVNALALATAGGTYMLLHVPGFMNPIVRVTLFYGVVAPIAVFAGVSLVTAFLVSAASRAVRSS